jgi:hypothetical protein
MLSCLLEITQDTDLGKNADVRLPVEFSTAIKKVINILQSQCLNTAFIFTCSHIVAKSAYYLRHIRRSICQHVSAQFPLDGFS